MRTTILFLALACSSGCGGDDAAMKSSEAAGQPASAQDAATDAAAQDAPEAAASSEEFGGTVADLEAVIAECAARAEHAAPKVKVQHILIGIKSPNPRTSQFKYDKAGALEQAAKVYGQIVAGADLGALVAEYSDDPGEGIYTMIKSGAPDYANGVYPRSQMAKVFGDVAWRLEVGEVGVGGYDRVTSPFGIHIIERLE